MKINEAIENLAFVMFDEEYDSYVYCLTVEEEIEEEKRILESVKTIAESKYKIGFEEIYKHQLRRETNFVIPTKRFIDRDHLISIDSDQLPW